MKKTQFEIIGVNHPHRFEYCEIAYSSDNKVERILMGGEWLYKMNLIDCVHGVDYIFVSKADIKIVEPERKRWKRI